MQPSADRIGDQGAEFQQLLGNHCLLVDVMDICQVAAEGDCLHLLPARVARNVRRVPFTCCDPPYDHLAVGLRRQLSPDPVGGADHDLHLGCVALETNSLEQINKKG